MRLPVADPGAVVPVSAGVSGVVEGVLVPESVADGVVVPGVVGVSVVDGIVTGAVAVPLGLLVVVPVSVFPSPPQEASSRAANVAAHTVNAPTARRLLLFVFRFIV